MNLIDKILGRKKTDPFEEAPVLLPWYFDKHKPFLTRENSRLTWKYIEKLKKDFVGLVTLNDDSHVLGIFNAYVYIHTSPKGDSFCVWTRSNQTHVGFPELTIELYVTNELKPFADTHESLLMMKGEQRIPYLLNGSPKASISFQLNADKEAFKVDFPEAFKVFDEFIAVCDIPNLYLQGNTEWHHTALVVMKPKDNWVFIYPQDWFNQDPKVDFGYQWITRAIRNKNNNHIIGEGIRIGKFELDETNRQLKRWL